MKIFRKERQSLRISRIRASRAVYMNGEGTEEVHVEFLTEEGQRLTLQIPHRQVPALIGELTDSYEAINPPLSRRNNYQAQWDGSDNS